MAGNRKSGLDPYTGIVYEILNKIRKSFAFTGTQ